MNKRYFVYLANLFLGFHYYLIIYINSNFLSKYLSDGKLNILYTIGATLSVFFLFIIPRILNKLNAKFVLLSITFLEFLTILSLSIFKTTTPIIISFITYQAIGILLFYCLDLFLESQLKDEKNTGFARALFLTALNITILISLIVVSLVAQNSLRIMYLLSALSLIPMALIVIYKFDTHIHKNKVFRLRDIVNFLKEDRDTFRILSINFLLQLFYAIMVIYLPLLLIKTAGFDWGTVGKMLAVMILPFLILEIPLGKIYDKKTGEKEGIIFGIIFISISTFILGVLGESSFWVWAIVLFSTRVGASFVEMGSESYFFKKVSDRHSGIISLFRATSPLSFIISPFVAIPALYFTNYSGLFIVLSLITLSALLFIPKKDTK